MQVFFIKKARFYAVSSRFFRLIFALELSSGTFYRKFTYGVGNFFGRMSIYVYTDYIGIIRLYENYANLDYPNR